MVHVTSAISSYATRVRGIAVKYHQQTLECVGISKLMTTSTCGISKPRLATSVATKIDRDFDLNLFNVPRRLD